MKYFVTLNSLLERHKIYGLKKILRYSFIEIYGKIWMQTVRKSFSQKGEDLIIDKLVRYRKKGFYVDVGAYDPHRFSNTKRFYLKGWRGINIEPDPENFKEFLSQRKRDININLGIGNENSILTYFKFFPGTASTFSKEEAEKNKAKGFKLLEKISIKVAKLSSLLEKYCLNRPIDFMTIDTEGYDLEVLISNDWAKFRPRVICIESSKKNDQITKFLLSRGYQKYLDKGLKLNMLFVRRGEITLEN